jgi:CHAT domain-containing protein
MLWMRAHRLWALSIVCCAIQAQAAGPPDLDAGARGIDLPGKVLPGQADAPATARLSDDEQEQLDQRNTHLAAARLALQELRGADAEAAVRQAIAIEIELFGDQGAHGLHSLELLARSQETQHAWEAARETRSEILNCCTAAFGTEDYRVLDARLGIERIDTLQRLSDEQRRELDECQALHVELELRFDKREYSAAIPQAARIVDIQLRVLGEESPEYARSLLWLAALHHAELNSAKARPLFEQAHAILAQRLGQHHPDTMTALRCLAIVCHGLKDDAAAGGYYRTLLDCGETLGADRPEFASLLCESAIVLQGLGDPEGAEAQLRRAVSLCRERCRTSGRGGGNSDSEAVETLIHATEQLALLQLDLKRAPRRALGDFVDATVSIAELMDVRSLLQSEREQLNLASALQLSTDCLLSIGQIGQLQAVEVYPLILSAKGQVFARQRAIRRLARETPKGSDESVTSIVARLEDRTRELGRLNTLFASLDSTSAARQRCENLAAEIDSLQRDLAGRISFVPSRYDGYASPLAVAADLPLDAVLVDIREFHQYRPADAAGQQPAWERQYVAFVIQPEMPIDLEWLGPADAVDRQIQLWRQSYGAGEGAAAGLQLRRLIWEPIRPLMGNANTVLLSVDGFLNWLPFAAIPGEEPGTCLIEEGFTFVAIPGMTFLQELIDTAPAAPLAGPRLLAVGDVDYGADPGVMRLATTRGEPDVDVGAPHNWGALDNTRVEVLAIKDSFDSAVDASRGGAAELLRREQATEAAVRGLAPQATYLHFATHGYFAAEQQQPVMISPPADRFWISLQDDRPLLDMHPGLLSGIVLAGANRPAESGTELDDGVLSALEVAELDLRQVDLVTLSACETGLGRSAGGEGVLGLQRAFQIAGVRTTVASLWKVPDEATRALMVDFYENLWRKNMSRCEALRQAQLTMLREGRDRGLTADPSHPPENQRVPPYYWAAFVISGDWR